MGKEIRIDWEKAFVGIMLGTAVGDAIGLPTEGISRRRIRRMHKGVLKHRLAFGRGMISDDTEHAFHVTQALVKNGDDMEAFAKSLGWKLRLWFLCLPPGLGMATLKSCVKLWLGFSPKKSGVFSAGNGPAMRSAMIGAYFHDDAKLMEKAVGISTRISHTDPKAETGALAVARLAAVAVENGAGKSPDIGQTAAMLKGLPLADNEWIERIGKLEKAFDEKLSVLQFADSLGLAKGVTGYIYDTVPVVIYAWLRHYGDYAATIKSVIECGGDTDTIGAIAGALAGAVTGQGGIPRKWIEGISDWPLSVRVLKEAAVRLAMKKCGAEVGPVGDFWFLTPLRNLFLLGVVLAHGFRRLLPPY